jgi:RNA polymerase sigma factor (sigma-70 family)
VLYLRLHDTIGDRIRPAKRLASRLRGAGSPLEAEDIDQQAFVIFCELVDEWQPERRPFVPFIVAMMRWHAYCYVRSSLHLRSTRIRIVRMSEYRQLQAEHLPSAAAGPAELVEGSEQWEMMVALLSDSGRRFVRSRFYEGLSTNQIARANHCSNRTVNRSLRAALELLRHNAQEELEVL